MPGSIDNDTDRAIERLLADPNIHFLMLHLPQLIEQYPALQPALERVQQLYRINMETSAISDLLGALNNRIAGLTRVLNAMEGEGEAEAEAEAEESGVQTANV